MYSIHRFSVSEKINDGEWIDLGERKLQILMTPGHTPDSLCLLDRDHGLLFTGDTYYPGPIYLFSPETDFEAYGRSVHRIAMLAGQLKLLLPAHNVPVAGPAVLHALDLAVQKVKNGEVTPKNQDGLREYVFKGFSLLMR